MQIAHKIQLDPTVKQVIYFNKACGTSRFVWNYALAIWNESYESGNKPSANELKKRFNQIKYYEFPWMKEVHRDTHSQPFADLQNAFGRFFKKKAKHPKFKKKGKSKDSFYVANDKFRIEDKRIRLPKIGWIRLTVSLRFEGDITSAVVSRKADRWFVSVIVDVGDYAKPRIADNVVGVDLGLTSFATLSTGYKVDAPKPLKQNLKKLQRLSKNHSRKQKGSNNRKKSQMKIARIYVKISNIRKDFIDKLTTMICRENQAVIIENLSVSNMIKNRKLSRAISDAGWYEFRRQLTYKSQIYGTELIVADRFYASSKTCSKCGSIKRDLSLKDRSYKCETCGVEIDRDVNAAKNLLTYGLKRAGGLPEIKACGAKIRPVKAKAIRWEAGTKPCSLVSTS